MGRRWAGDKFMIWVHGWMGGKEGGIEDGWMGGWMEGGWVDERVDRWVGGYSGEVNVQTEAWVDKSNIPLLVYIPLNVPKAHPLPLILSCHPTHVRLQ